MNSEDFYNISRFLFSNVYPTHILESKKCSHAKKNFRVRATQFQIGENNKIFKCKSHNKVVETNQ